MRTLALCALMALTGCAPLAYRDVTGQRRTSDAFGEASRACQSAARNMAEAVASGGAVDAGLAPGARFTTREQQTAYDRCMRAEGWAS